jgi:ABC-type transporter Mla MlaB component
MRGPQASTRRTSPRARRRAGSWRQPTMSMLHGAVTAGPSGPAIVLADEADLTTAAELNQLLAAQLDGGTTRLTVDLSGLRFADSAEIRELIHAHRAITQRGGPGADPPAAGSRQAAEPCSARTRSSPPGIRPERPRPGRTARQAGHGGCHWSCSDLPDQAGRSAVPPGLRLRRSRRGLREGSHGVSGVFAHARERLSHRGLERRGR